MRVPTEIAMSISRLVGIKEIAGVNAMHFLVTKNRAKSPTISFCRATASISVDFQNVLQYSIRRKKRETARGTLMNICVVLPRV